MQEKQKHKPNSEKKKEEKEEEGFLFIVKGG